MYNPLKNPHNNLLQKDSGIQLKALRKKSAFVYFLPQRLFTGY